MDPSCKNGDTEQERKELADSKSQLSDSIKKKILLIVTTAIIRVIWKNIKMIGLTGR